MRQCFAPLFTVNGVVVNRTFAEPTAVYIRLPQHGATVFKCCSFGLEAPSDMGCRLDAEVLPLYQALCLPDVGGGILQCQRLIDGGVARMCENTLAEYQPTNTDRTAT